MSDTKYPLTQYSHGAGCGCKISPQILSQILQTDTVMKENEKLIVGNHSNDDAAVYDLGDGNALISTTDFFMPIVDDAFDFGRIAAANAISDVYAMGGRPMLAIAILGWPVDKIPVTYARQVLEGARAVCAEAGISLAGGHSIDTLEPIFGLAVNGQIQLKNLKRNNTAQEGDLLLLTKSLGIGVLSTAQKKGVLESAHFDAFLQQITKLNSIGALLGKMDAVHAMTDVTGFGLLGHTIEMAAGSGLSAEIYYDQLSVLPGVHDYLKNKVMPGGTQRNWKSYSDQVEFSPNINQESAIGLLPDPQTNGGLLIAFSPDALKEIQELFIEHGLSAYLQPIGKMLAKKEKTIIVC